MSNTHLNIATPANDQLKRRVSNFLQQAGRAGLQSLEVEAYGGAVTVRGRVRSYYERQLAINCCQRVAGVVQVVDDIQVANDEPLGVAQIPSEAAVMT